VKIVTPFQSYSQADDNVVWMYLEFGMAQKYVDDLSRNVKRGLRARAESGWFPSLPPPGYVNRENDEGRNVIVRDPKRFDLVRKFWDLMLTGNHMPFEICRIANTAWGYKTGRGNPLARNTVYSIFANPFYHGIYEYPKGSDTWHTGRHTPMVTEEEFDTVQRLLSRSKKMPRNRGRFAFTGLIRCGGCDSAVTAEEKHQLICSHCRFKFAHRSKAICPWCKLPIAEMRNPRELHYTYYHCTKSGNPACTEHSVTGEDVDRQIVSTLARVRLPIPHDLWLNRAFARLTRIRDEADALTTIRQLFPAATPEIQRLVAIAVFSQMTLRDRRLSLSLKPPFVFSTENEMPSPFGEHTLAEEPMKEQVS
jgi:hypothetical protein